jgi:hypothetical protein
MSLYVLAEKTGFLASMFGQSAGLVELHTIQHPRVGECIALFLSPVDAAICLQYLNRQPHEGRKNDYEIRIHSDPTVTASVRALGAMKQMYASLVCGFATCAKGKLVVVGGVFSLAHTPLLAADMNWIFGNASKPQPDVITSTYASLAHYGAADHAEDIDKLDLLEPVAIHKIAEIALAQIGAMTSGQSDGLSVYSPIRQAWRRLA